MAVYKVRPLSGTSRNEYFMPDNTSFPVQKRALGYCLPCVISIKIELLQVDASFLD